jgi:hypothetical protein
MPARKRRAPPKKSRKEIRALVKQKKLSRELYGLPLDVKILIFQFAVLANMAVWAKDHAHTFRDTLYYFRHPAWGDVYPPRGPLALRGRGWRKRALLSSHAFDVVPYPVPICEISEVKHKVRVPWKWVILDTIRDRLERLDCRKDEWTPHNHICEFEHHPKCWCKDCCDVRDLDREYRETMRHWFLKYQGLKTEWITQIKDYSMSEEKHVLKLGFIVSRQRLCEDEAPDAFWNYLGRHYTWSKTLRAYVPK